MKIPPKFVWQLTFFDIRSTQFDYWKHQIKHSCLLLTLGYTLHHRNMGPLEKFLPLPRVLSSILTYITPVTSIASFIMRSLYTPFL